MPSMTWKGEGARLFRCDGKSEAIALPNPGHVSYIVEHSFVMFERIDARRNGIPGL